MNCRDLPGKSSCGCCEMPAEATPEAVENRPGLSAISYRVGTYASFRQAMIQAIPSYPELKGNVWTARTDDDYGIVFLEMWAYLADILTFYQERIANEAYLRTAILPESVRWMAGLLDYRLSPGSAASVCLAFTLDKEKQVKIPVGLRVQSVPGQGEKPLKFETIEAVDARAGINKLRIYPSPQARNPFEGGSSEGNLHPDCVAAISREISVGDQMAVFTYETINDEPVEEKEIKALRQNGDLTTLVWKPEIRSRGRTIENTHAFRFVRKYRHFGHDAPNKYISSYVDGHNDIKWEIKNERNYVFDPPIPRFTLCLDSVYDDLKKGTKILVHVKNNFYEFSWSDISGEIEGGLREFLMNEFSINLGDADIIEKIDDKTIKISNGINPISLTIDELDDKNTQLSYNETNKFVSKMENGKLYIKSRTHNNAESKAILLAVEDISQVSMSYGPLNSTATMIKVIAENAANINAVAGINSLFGKEIEIYRLEGSEIKFLNYTYPRDGIKGDTFYVPLTELGSIEPKRVLILDDKEHNPQVVTTAFAEPSAAYPDLLAVTFVSEQDRNRTLDSESAHLYGNVALATHGETVRDEIIGDGNASLPLQSFAIGNPRVTYVPQSNAPRGVANTLQLRVDGILWHEVDSLYGRPGEERVYTTEVDNDGKMTARFGDGINGARLTSGSGNVTATYRKGLGREGNNVKAGSLKILLDRPIWLKSVINPADAKGGEDPEKLEDARKNAPNTVRTFDRIVSLKDFEDAAREFKGIIAKAKSSWQWDGEDQSVLLTVAAKGDAIADKSDPLIGELFSYLNARRDLNRKLLVKVREKVPITVEAEVKADPDYLDEAVQKAAADALLDCLSFENLSLGQAVHLSDLYLALQRVDGVVAARITRLCKKSSPSGDPEKHIFLKPDELAAIEDPSIDIKIDLWRGEP